MKDKGKTTLVLRPREPRYKMKTKRFSIELAGISAGFIFKNDPASAAVIGRRYGDFRSGAVPDMLFEAVFKDRKQNPYRPSVGAKNGAVRLKRGDFDCALDLRAGVGVLECRPSPQSFDSFLRAFYSRELLLSGGMMLHSAGIIRNGKAYIFPGRSGAGKSTLSRLAAAAGAEVISDEINLLRPAGGRWRAHGSPFWGEMRAGGRRGSWPLGGIILLEKGRRHRFSPCSRPEAFRLLLRCLVNFSAEPADSRRAMANAARALAVSVSAKLEFSRRDAGFLELL